jgi:O-antigen ligase
MKLTSARAQKSASTRAGISYEDGMIPALVVLSVVCLLGFTLVYPRLALVLWLLALETSPDVWLCTLLGWGAREAIIGAMKGAGLVLAAVLALRTGTRRDRWNPSFAYGVMFLTGIIHGLYPGLTVLASLRSLLGSAAPLLFSFTRLPPAVTRAVITTLLWAPLASVVLGAGLEALGVGQVYVLEQGALRLGGSGEPPYLAGFALIGLYAGLMEWLDHPRPGIGMAVLLNLLLILAAGARAPLLVALLPLTAVLFLEGRVLVLAFGGALAAAAVLLAPWLGVVRVIGLADLGEATNLSHRDLIWPYFQQAIAASPLFGWGLGAGKAVIPYTSTLNALLGTNAAHNEYLRIATEGGAVGLLLLIALFILWVRHNTAALPARPRWLLRVIFIAFAIQSLTDNTLIATTSSAFFLWVSCVFANAANGSTHGA